jgi:hypothetical protein
MISTSTLQLIGALFGLGVTAWMIINYLLSGSRPPARVKVPRPGKLEKIISPELKAFVASLPRPTGDPLASLCQPIDPKSIPLFNDRITAVMPLWRSAEGYTVAWIRWGSRTPKRVEFVRLSESTDDDDLLALTEQGFLAKFTIELLQKEKIDEARRASAAMGFKHFDETRQFFDRWSRTKPEHVEIDEDGEEDEASSAHEDALFDFLQDIDKRSRR